MKKNREKKIYLGAPTSPEDEAICLFAGLLANPDKVLSLCLSHKSEFLAFVLYSTGALSYLPRGRTSVPRHPPVTSLYYFD